LPVAKKDIAAIPCASPSLVPVLRGFSRKVKQDSEASNASGGESDRRE
jgi:hypothetical protein